MDSPSYIILSRLSAQMRASELTAHNLANADTPGFRASRPVFAEVVTRQGRVAGPRSASDVGYAWDRASWRDIATGPLTATGNPFDIALSGEGYFVVETPRGERYTRAGRFALGPDGRLVDHAGHPVLNTSSQPIALAPNDTRVEIQGDGTIRSENGVLGRLRVVRFGNEQALRAEGDRHFDADGAVPEEVARPSLVQGSVEGSNVRSVQEITSLITAQRAYEMNSRVITASDSMLETLTRLR